MEDLIKKKIDFINLTPTSIKYGYNSHFVQEEDGLFSWYIPSFDIYFSSNTKEEGDNISRAMVKSFMNYWLKEKGFRSFVLQVFKLGYKTSSHEEFKRLLNRTNLTANLKGAKIAMPQEFANSESFMNDGQLSMAV